MPEPTRFIADAMLGSLARKLRIFGYDTLYFREGTDAELERVARAEGRVLLTSDAALASHSGRGGLAVLAVSGRSDGSRLRSLVGQARLASLDLAPGGPRCAVCNSLLERIGRSTAAGLLPESVTRRHRLFYWCGVCRKAYWRGRHWSRLRKLSLLLHQR
jgi:hypothetical protein